MKLFFLHVEVFIRINSYAEELIRDRQSLMYETNWKFDLTVQYNYSFLNCVN